MLAVRNFASDAELLAAFVPMLQQQLQGAIDVRGHAYLVVSGGRTPIPLFEQLAQLPLDWSRVTVCLADDRRVPLDHDASNERLVLEHLATAKGQKTAKGQALKGSALKCLPLSLISLGGSLSEVQQRLASLPTFDVVILGMGDDGHTASLFPCSAELQHGLTTSDDALLVQPTTAPHQRITLSKQRLLNSRHIYIHVSGASKAAVLQQALLQGPDTAMPIRAFLRQQQVPVTVMLAAPRAETNEV
ncbi:6-phosphogluconolactonase [Pseudidiomarina mangrovi]|uniref:6-phosphogluconolactonase n=1 Tax=Pseudidiomarina mangrovi TaxID=2487133 RepID=UPI000FCB815E|nr:6-phosphogluconolactonase [Pseudidiomarina mangrovi]